MVSAGSHRPLEVTGMRMAILAPCWLTFSFADRLSYSSLIRPDSWNDEISDSDLLPGHEGHTDS